MATKKIPYVQITVTELKAKLKEKGESVTGLKQVLYDRLYGIEYVSSLLLFRIYSYFNLDQLTLMKTRMNTSLRAKL